MGKERGTAFTIFVNEALLPTHPQVMVACEWEMRGMEPWKSRANERLASIAPKGYVCVVAFYSVHSFETFSFVIRELYFEN